MFENENGEPLDRTWLRPTHVVAVPRSAELKIAGVTLDWDAVQPVGASGLVLADGSYIPPNTKHLRFGQVVTRIAASGKFGPYDPNATDGRQLLIRGQCYVSDMTIPEYDHGSASIGGRNVHVGGMVEGGPVWKDRLLQSGDDPHSLSAGPTWQEFQDAFLLLRFVTEPSGLCG